MNRKSGATSMSARIRSRRSAWRSFFLSGVPSAAHDISRHYNVRCSHRPQPLRKSTSGNLKFPPTVYCLLREPGVEPLVDLVLGSAQNFELRFHAVFRLSGAVGRFGSMSVGTFGMASVFAGP